MPKTASAQIVVIGIDIGKNSFHVVGHDQRGSIVLRQKWSRGQIEARLANLPPCLIGMEACVGAHHLSRRLKALGHDARLMPAKYVRPYAKGQKNDFNDAEAITEAVQRPTMKFVATKTADQFDLQALTAGPYIGSRRGMPVASPARSKSLKKQTKSLRCGSRQVCGHWQQLRMVGRLGSFDCLVCGIDVRDGLTTASSRPRQPRFAADMAPRYRPGWSQTYPCVATRLTASKCYQLRGSSRRGTSVRCHAKPPSPKPRSSRWA